jgi:hypothetical protein
MGRQSVENDARGIAMRKLVTFVCALGAAGCVSSEPVYLKLTPPDAGGQPIVNATGAAGQVGATGQAGAPSVPTGGNAGAPGGSGSGAAGAAGSSSATSTAFATGAAGASGQAGRSGSTNDAGVTNGQGSGIDASATRDSGGDTVSPYAATWTDIYNKMLNNPSYASNCTGAPCHNPGTQKGLDLSTQAKGYTTIKGKLVVGNPNASQVVSDLSGGKMPQSRSKMPTADLNVIKAWIMAGAPNN